MTSVLLKIQFSNRLSVKRFVTYLAIPRYAFLNKQQLVQFPCVGASSGVSLDGGCSTLIVPARPRRYRVLKCSISTISCSDLKPAGRSLTAQAGEVHRGLSKRLHCYRPASPTTVVALSTRVKQWYTTKGLFTITYCWNKMTMARISLDVFLWCHIFCLWRSVHSTLQHIVLQLQLLQCWVIRNITISHDWTEIDCSFQ